ncbi:glycosyltransferase family 2 protein [Turicibacter bilis]|uniref:glycosyltransferase family 2 protein n=1 Tax=Turicibacter bilis TaxID=2735723 RepID=UPI0031B9E375
MDKISIIVPVYNAEKYLDQCIQSILNQTHTNIELILVNDGSKDLSEEICLSYEKLDDRVKFINQSNSGVSVARNSGIDYASGTYIGFVDSDDWIHPQMYEILYARTKEHRADLAMCNYTRISNYGIRKDALEFDSYGFLEKKKMYETIIYPMIGSSMENLSAAPVMGSNWRCLYKADVIKNHSIKFKKITIAEDMLFHLTYMLKIQNVYVEKEVLYYYRYNNESATLSFIPNLWETLILQLNEVEKILEEHHVYDLQCRERMMSTKFYFICWCIENELHKGNKKNYWQKVKTINQYKSAAESKGVFTWKNILKMSRNESIIWGLVKLRLYGIFNLYLKKLA